MIIPARLYWAHKGEAWLTGLPFSSELVPGDDGNGLWPRLMVHQADGVLPNPPGMTLVEVEIEFIPMDDSVFDQFRMPERPDSVPCYMDIIARERMSDLMKRIYQIQEEGVEEFKKSRPLYETAWTKRPQSS